MFVLSTTALTFIGLIFKVIVILSCVFLQVTAVFYLNYRVSHKEVYVFDQVFIIIQEMHIILNILEERLTWYVKFGMSNLK